MPKLMQAKKFIEIFDLGELKSEDFPEITVQSVTAEKYVMLMYNDCLASVRAWAEKKYPQATVRDQCSFAGLVLYYATGAYGGYGTETYKKERIAERKINAFYNQNVSAMPPEDMTEKIIELCAEYILK